MQLLQGIVQHFERVSRGIRASVRLGLTEADRLYAITDQPSYVCRTQGKPPSDSGLRPSGDRERKACRAFAADLQYVMFTASCTQMRGLTVSTAFYGLLTSNGRASAVVAILNSANSNDIANYSFNPDTKYVIDPDDTAHDVSKVLNEAGKVSVRNRILDGPGESSSCAAPDHSLPAQACGLLDDELDEVLEMIGDGRGRATDGEKRKKVEDPRTTKLFEQMCTLPDTRLSHAS